LYQKNKELKFMVRVSEDVKEVGMWTKQEMTIKLVSNKTKLLSFKMYNMYVIHNEGLIYVE